MWRYGCLVAFFLLGCGDPPLPCERGPLADRWTLSAPGITVEIERATHRYTVKDGAGTPVLSSLGPGVGDGYATAGWTAGHVEWSNLVSPGYFAVDAELEPWRDDLRIVAAEQKSATTVELTLSRKDQLRCVHETYTVRDSTLRVEATLDGEGAPPRAWSAGFATPANEAFLGFGERYNHVNQRGLNLYSWAEEGGLGKSEATPKGPGNPFPNGETMTYYPVPFFVSSKGYAFWLDSTWRSEFRLASDRADAWRVWDLGPRLAYEVYVPIPDDKRPWPQHLVDLFTARTGRPMIPPAWTFGPRRRIGRNAMQGGVTEIQAMRDRDLAITSLDDALHFLPAGSDVGDEASIAQWTKDATRLGYRVNGYYNPYISKDPSPLDGDAQTGLANHWFLRDANGDPSVVWLISGHYLNLYTIDVTSPEATAWFTRMFDRALNLGYSGWMYDFGEYVQPNVVSSTGMTGEELHNLFPVLYQKAAHEALEAGPHKGDWLTFARSGFTGASHWTPMVWGGDPDASFDDALGLPTIIRGGVNMGLSGVAHWGSDIGGFKCLGDGYKGADGELVTRWIEAGSMSSNMQDQDACSTAPDTGMKASIWSSTDAQAAWKKYARLHTRLFPYLSALAVEAHATGAPTMRALFFEHPDEALASVDDTYYLGPALLVAPVVQRGARSRTVPLPAGHYLDLDTRAIQTGPASLTVEAPLDRLPLYLRDGYLVPLLDETIDTLADESDATIVGPADVATVYDVWGLLSKTVGHSAFTLADGGTLAASFTGGFAAPSSPMAQSEAELATCAACWLADAPAGGAQRVRISATGDVTAGGLSLSSSVGRRIRWDLTVVEP